MTTNGSSPMQFPNRHFKVADPDTREDPSQTILQTVLYRYITLNTKTSDVPTHSGITTTGSSPSQFPYIHVSVADPDTRADPPQTMLQTVLYATLSVPPQMAWSHAPIVGVASGAQLISANRVKINDGVSQILSIHNPAQSSSSR